MITLSSSTNVQTVKFASFGCMLAQAIVLPTILQLLVTTTAIAQTKPTTPRLIKNAQTLGQCRWSLWQQSTDQTVKIPVTVTDWQALTPEITALSATVQKPSHLTLQAQPILSTAIGGGDDPDSFMSDDCWRKF